MYSVSNIIIIRHRALTLEGSLFLSPLFAVVYNLAVVTAKLCGMAVGNIVCYRLPRDIGICALRARALYILHT